MSPITIASERVRAFRRKILTFYRTHGRKLPFRETTDPYAITVAEIMLQQTQVERVIEKYLSFIAKWPNWRALAGATSRELLSAWSGLGYNRRALYLGEMAKVVAARFDDQLPSDPKQLRTLPGVGEYTANAIAIFAFNKPLVTIDTNIRKVLLHEFDLPADTSKADLVSLAERLLPRRRSRDWHNALMDYARVALKNDLHYIAPLTKQSRFQGSRRQIRGAIVRALTERKRVSLEKVAGELNRSVDDVREAALSLERDGVVVVGAKTVRLA